MSRREKPKLSLRRPPPATASQPAEASAMDAFVSGGEQETTPVACATIKRRRPKAPSRHRRPAEKRARTRSDHRRMKIELPSELASELLAYCAASEMAIDQALREAVSAWLKDDASEHLPASRYEW